MPRAHRCARTARLPTPTIRGMPAHDNAIDGDGCFRRAGGRAQEHRPILRRTE
jgi:hypothetical protein